MLSRTKFTRTLASLVVLIELGLIGIGGVALWWRVDVISNRLSAENNEFRRTVELVLEHAVADIDHFVALYNADHDRGAGRALLREFAATHAFYRQMRILDASGRELFRLDRGGDVILETPRAFLQDKSDRYYFKSLQGLAANALYLSKFDENEAAPAGPGRSFRTFRVGRVIQYDGGRAYALLNLDSTRVETSSGEAADGGFRNQVENGDVPEVASLARLTRKFQASRFDRGQGADIEGGSWTLVSTLAPHRLWSELFALAGALILGGVAVNLAVWSLVRRIRSQMQSVDYRAALDQTAIITVTDAKGVITYVNEKFEKISGYPSAEVIGKTHAVVNSGRHPPTFFRDLWRGIARGDIWQGEILNRAKDGTYYWVDTAIVPFKGPDGGIAKFLSIRYDITDRKRAQRRLVVLDAVLEASRTEILSLDPGTLDIKKVNTWFLRNYGGAPGDLEGLSLDQIVADGGALLKTTLQALDPAAKSPLTVEFPVRRLNGTTYWVDGTAMVFEDEFGRETVMVVRDVTERRRLKDVELVRLRQLCAGIGHEINTPLAVIGSSNGILRRMLAHLQPLPAGAVEQSQQIEDTVDQISRIVHGLKDLMIGSDGAKSPWRSVDVAQVCERAVEQCMGVMEARGIALLVDLASLRTEVPAEEVQLCQAIVNLLMNAAYAAKGSAAPWVRLYGDRYAGAFRINVADSGTGVSAEVASRIFEPFFTTKDLAEGSGLGLSIVDGIMRAHGGSAQLDQSAAHTIFRLVFPVVPIGPMNAPSAPLASYPSIIR